MRCKWWLVCRIVSEMGLLSQRGGGANMRIMIPRMQEVIIVARAHTLRQKVMAGSRQ